MPFTGKYFQVADVKAEGGVASSDSVIEARIAMVEDLAELKLGTWWEVRTKTYRVKGSGADRVILEQYPLGTLTVTVDDSTLSADEFDIDENVIVLRSGRFPGRDSTVIVTGFFGTVTTVPGAYDGDPPTYACPAPMKLALIKWVCRELPLAADPDAAQDRRAATATSVSVAGRTTAFAGTAAPYSGDPEIDSVLAMYRAPATTAVL